MFIFTFVLFKSVPLVPFNIYGVVESTFHLEQFFLNIYF